jgi:hypothetical protein
MRYNSIEIDVCTVCWYLTGNGEYNDGTDAARDCVRGQRAIWGDNARHFTSTTDDELGFSRSSCDGCGDDHHGDRYRVVVMIPLTKIRTGAGGRMYVSSEDGSYTEVYDGTELVSTIQRDWRGKLRQYAADVA